MHAAESDAVREAMSEHEGWPTRREHQLHVPSRWLVGLLPGRIALDAVHFLGVQIHDLQSEAVRQRSDTDGLVQVV